MSLADLPVGEFLERVAARQPAPGGGTTAAVTAALGAALVAMAARFSGGELADVVARADDLRERACALADADLSAYPAVIEARRLPREDPERPARVRAALRDATEVPVAIVEVAREVGELGARAAREGNANLRGDAVTGLLLADAAARSAARLVGLNVEAGDLDGALVDRCVAACAVLADAVQGVEADA
jgi:methenyltetrahydrofolate cyclohydrolase